MHFNADLVSLQMILKYRLDRMGIPYAAGFDRYSSNSLIFKIPVDRLWYIELEHLADHLEYAFTRGGKWSIIKLDTAIGEKDVDEKTREEAEREFQKLTALYIQKEVQREKELSEKGLLIGLDGPNFFKDIQDWHRKEVEIL